MSLSTGLPRAVTGQAVQDGKAWLEADFVVLVCPSIRRFALRNRFRFRLNAQAHVPGATPSCPDPPVDPVRLAVDFGLASVIRLLVGKLLGVF